MKSAHVIIGLVAAAGVGYYLYKKKQGVNVVASLLPSSTPVPVTQITNDQPQQLPAPVPVGIPVPTFTTSTIQNTGINPTYNQNVPVQQQQAELPSNTQDSPQLPAQVPIYTPVATPTVTPTVQVIPVNCKYKNQLVRSRDRVNLVDAQCVKHYVPGNVFARDYKGRPITQITYAEELAIATGPALQGLNGFMF